MKDKVPYAFHSAILDGIEEGEKKMKLRNKLRITGAAVLAACLMVVALATNLQVQNDDTVTATWLQAPTDNTVTAQPTEEPQISTNIYVYCTEYGMFYHTESDCSGMQNATEMSVNEARNQGKTPCPICAATETTYHMEDNFNVYDRIDKLVPGIRAWLSGFRESTDNLTYYVSPTGNSITICEDSLAGWSAQYNFSDYEEVVIAYFCKEADFLSYSTYCDCEFVYKCADTLRLMLEAAGPSVMGQDSGFTPSSVSYLFVEEDLVSITVVLDHGDMQTEMEMDAETGVIYRLNSYIPA